MKLINRKLALYLITSLIFLGILLCVLLSWMERRRLKDEMGVTEAAEVAETEEVVEVVVDPVPQEINNDFQIAPADLEVIAEENGSKCFGNLVLEIPKGWRVEQRSSEDGITQCVLVDIHSQYEAEGMETHSKYYEHEITITPYDIKNIPLEPLELNKKLMDYFSFTKAESAPVNEIEDALNTVVLYLEDIWGSKLTTHCILAEGDNGAGRIYFVQEWFDYDYTDNTAENFREYLEEGFVKIRSEMSSGEKITVSEFSLKDRASNILLNQGTDKEMLVYGLYDGDETMFRFYKDALLSRDKLVTSKRCFVEGVKIADINQDGYEDFIPYCWAEYSAEDENFKGYIWNPEKNNFEKYTGEQLLSEYGEFFSALEPVVVEEVQIPESLKTELKPLVPLEKKVIQEKLTSLATGRELTGEEVVALSKDNKDIYKRLMDAAIYGSEGWDIWQEVDADNDGISDVFLRQYTGGSGGFVSYYLFKGNEDGTYTESENIESVREDFTFIRWEDKNYFVRITFDYSQKIYNGIVLYAFSDGSICDEVRLMIAKAGEGKEYTTTVLGLKDEAYRKVADGVIRDLNVDDVDFIMSKKQPIGTAEEHDSDKYLWYSDYDNDGVVEEYEKRIFQTTNMSTVSGLNLRIKDENDKKLFYDFLYEGEENVIQMWVDNTEFGNVIYLVSVVNLHDFNVKAYLLKDEQFDCLFRIDYTFRVEVKEEPTDSNITDFTSTNESASTNESVTETIYKWSENGSEVTDTYAYYDRWVENYDKTKIGEFIDNYLLAQGIEKETPDGVSYDPDGKLNVEYYVDEQKKQYCFIVHFWTPIGDSVNGIREWEESVWGTTHTLSEEDLLGKLVNEVDTQQEVIREQLYDNTGKELADVSYEYVTGFPFPLITEFDSQDENWNLFDVSLARNQKAWFFKENIQFDEAGNVVAYIGDGNRYDWKEYFKYSVTCEYDSNGKLTALSEEIPESMRDRDDVDYTGYWNFNCDENGNVKTVDYQRSYYTYGSGDCHGTIEYDTRGRMIYNGYYVTHGYHENYFLYEEDADKPWACLQWCGYSPGFDAVYLFLE